MQSIELFQTVYNDLHITRFHSAWFKPNLPSLWRTVLASSVNCPARKGVTAEEVECTQSADDGLRPQNRLRVRLNMPNLLKTLLRDQANTTTES